MNLQKSKAYDQFEENPHQRDLNLRHVQKLAGLMKKYGFLPSKPVQVYRRGKKLVIVDGHHRYQAAKSLGIEFYYVIESTAAQESMIDENVAVKTWALIDYIHYYSNNGNSHYQELIRYAAKGIPMTMAASMLYGQSACSGNAQRFVKEGTFKVKDRAQINRICQLIDDLGSHNQAAKSRTFIGVISKCAFTPAIDWETLVKKLRAQSGTLEKTNNADQMLLQIEEIYNFRSQAKLPLAWAVKEAMKSRQEKVNAQPPSLL